MNCCGVILGFCFVLRFLLFFTGLHFQNQQLTILFCCLDFASQVDLFQRDSDNEEENEEFDETEVKWRKERFEREQWLREQVLVRGLLSLCIIAGCEIVYSSS